MNKLLKTGIGSTLATLAVAALSASANATTITFDPISGNVVGIPLNTPFVEGDFTYQAVAGNGISGSFSSTGGNPAPGLSTIAADTGEQIVFEFSRIGGGLFTFDSFESLFNGPIGGKTDGWVFFGSVGGNLTQVFGFDTSSTSFTTTVPTFTAPIDKLTIQFSTKNDAPLVVDNFVLTPAAATPEPSALLGLGLFGVGALVSRKRKA